MENPSVFFDRMRDKMEERVYSYIVKNHMIEKDDVVVVGVSGGPDSICLFHVLRGLQERISFSMHVVYVNHKIRKEAVEEAQFVRLLCEKYKIAFSLFEIDVEKMAQEEKLSLEEAGRNARYKAFREIQKSIGSSKIAIAHTKNDRAETVLFHLFRGSGLKGLGAINAVREDIIRPILCLERKDVETYLRNRGYEFRIDLSNDTDDYTRNRIRHHILPFANTEVCENIISHINETSQIAEETENFIHKTMLREKENCVTKTKEGYLEIQGTYFLSLHVVLQKAILRDCLFVLAASSKDITSKNIENLLALFTKQVGKEVMLPYKLMATKTYTGVCIANGIMAEKKKELKTCQERKLIRTKLPESIIEKGVGVVSFREFMADPFQEIPEKKYTKWFDYDKIIESLVLRTRKPGDYLTVNLEEDKKTIKEYMINEKIPKEMRDTIFLFADGSHVLWVIGYRISQHYKVTDQTKRILQIQIEEC